MPENSIDLSVFARPLAVHQPWLNAFIRNQPRSTTIGRSASTNDPERLAEPSHALSSDGMDDDDPTASITVDRGVAIVPIHGMITKRGRFWWMRSFSSDHASVVIRRLVERDDVHAIVLDIDSGGGQVDGTDAFSETVYNLRDELPIVGVINEFAASAAYWFASSCSEIVISRTGEAGSIGVYTMHVDWSAYEKALGVESTVIYAGKYKAAHERSLTDETREFYQDQIDELYRLFVDTVARNRKRSTEYVLSEMADARIFIGEQAVAAGLADRIGTLDQVIEELADSSPQPQSQFRFGGSASDQGNQHANEEQQFGQWLERG